MRKEFEMTEAQAKEMLHYCKDEPTLVAPGGSPLETAQQRMNRGWKWLAQELGFIWHTVLPVEGKPARFFTAEVPDHEAEVQ